MKKISQTLKRTLLFVPMFVLALGLVGPVVVGDNAGALGLRDGIDKANSKDDMAQGNVEDIVEVVVETLLFLVGALGVIMLIYGGIRYVTSGGNQESVRAAKNTILYSVIGIVVAVFAYAIVNWAFGAAKDGTVIQGGGSSSGGDSSQESGGDSSSGSGNSGGSSDSGSGGDSNGGSDGGGSDDEN